MKIGILSDSHDNVPMIRAAINAFDEAGTAIIVHAGDIISPFAARELLAAAVPVRAVYGNNDGDQAHLSETLDGIQPGARKFTIDGKRFLLVHDREALSDGDLEGVDILVCGHSHAYHCEPGPPLVINPGECGGWTTGNPTAAILDTRSMKVTRIQLG
jgi:putative phosphoesterase